MRVLIDYRPALSERTGVGEYTHQLAKALLRRSATDRTAALELTLFSSSWKDRLSERATTSELAGARMIDRRIPVRVLNFAWHRMEWPPAETLARRPFDVTHSLHPLLLPAHAAAQVVTIHDLNFLTYPERTRAEIRRDYPALAGDHAQRADRVIVPSQFTAREVEQRFGVSVDRLSVCPPGAPDWTPRASAPRNGYILFVGTLEPRKNLGALLDAYARLVTAHDAELPELVIAGKATEQSRAWLHRIECAPLKGLVRHIGYVDPSDRRQMYERARLLVQPSFEEGFGIPVLEALTLGVPVVAAARGALPEVLGDTGLMVDPERPADLADAMVRMLTDQAFAAECVRRGIARSREFRWDRTAARVYDAYRQALDHRLERTRRPD